MSEGGPAKKPVVAAGGEVCQLTVSTQSKRDEIGIQTLVGDYADKGTNHGRRYYQKMQKIPGHEDIKVFLYYWDSRDGADFCGWWFGDQLGGSQVWARCNSHGATPPRIGWKIPWDADKAEPGILFVDPFKNASASASSAAPASAGPAKPGLAQGNSAAGARPGAAAGATAGAPAPNAAALAARVKKATGQVEAAEAATKTAVEEAKASAAGEVDESILQAVEKALKAQQQAVLETQKSLTQDIGEARKGGVTATASVTELSKLSPRVRTLQTNLTTELNRVKDLLTKAQKAAASAKDAEAQKAQEEKDTKELQESLPAAMDLVSGAEDSVEGCHIMAAPLLAEPPEDESELLNKATQDIEAAALDGQNKITEARRVINLKLSAARKYAPETRKNALSEFSSMQQKLTEAQKKLNPYKTFKKDFKARVEAKKALAEIADKISGVELEVEKASLMTAAAESGQMSEDEVASAEKLVGPTQTAITQALRTVDGKIKATTDGPTKDELNEIKTRATASSKKLQGVVTVLKSQREGLASQQVVLLAGEKVDKAEESLVKCQEAEMPFLKGIEVLPADESTKAIAECDAASSQAGSAIGQAQTFIKTKLAESKKYAQALQKTVTEELTQLQTRLEATAKKLTSFKKETSDRKMASIMAEVVEAVTNCEKKVNAFVEAGSLFLSEELESVSTQALKEAGEKTSATEKEASAAVIEARKLIGTKQKEAKGGDAVQALSKLQGRLTTSQQELAKTRKAASNAEKLITGKELITSQEETIKSAEAEVEKVDKLANPESADEKITDEAIEEVTTAGTAAQKVLKASSRAIETAMAGAVPALKTSLQKLVDRIKKSQDKLNEVMAKTKDERERVMGEAYVRQGQKKVEEVEAALEKVNDAELPFLKGIEVLPLQEATETIKESEAAAAGVQKAIGDARTFIASKNLEIKSYKEVASKPAIEEFAKLTERINAAAAKLSQFRKDTEGRKKTAQMQEAGEKIATAEAEVKKLTAAIAPFQKKEAPKEAKEGEEAPAAEEPPTPDDAAGEEIAKASKEAQARVDEARTFLAERTKDGKNVDAAQKEALEKLKARLTETSSELAKGKKVALEYEHKFISKKALNEAKEMIANMEEEISKATEACKPLLEEGGEEFLVASSAVTLATVLMEHMDVKGMKVDELFTEANGGNASGSISQDAFVAYLGGLPEAIKRDEVTFVEERRLAIFKHLDADKDGAISLTDFKEAFRRHYICVKGISITDVFKIADSKTTGKVETDEVCEALGPAKKDDSNGMTRLECQIIGTDKRGWITMMGNQGTKYLEAISPFTTFTAQMDKTLEETLKGVNKVSSFLNSKAAELKGPGSTGPLAEARAELSKLRPKVASASTTVDGLKKKAVQAKKDFAKKELAEKNAHIEARERKEAQAITAPVAEKVEAMEAAAKQLEEVATPLTSLKGAEIEAFATPVSVLEDGEKLVTTISESVTEVKACVKEALGKLPKMPKGPMLEGKKDLIKMQSKADSTTRVCKSTIEAVRSAISTIVDAKTAKATAVLRTEVQTRGITLDALFSELAGGGERITEEAFCKRLEGLADLSITPEHAKLLCRNVEAGGVGRRKFLSFLQQYYVVIKGIAVTNEFDIGKAKTIRKAEIDEVIEVLEGPQVDEKLGLTRIRGKSLQDAIEGWISVKGNQGTAFLQEVEKPYYSCAEEVAMDSDFKGEGQAPIRTLKVDEVIELIEGPRKETFPPALRIRVKAVSDGATGWLTAKDQKGVQFAEQDVKYYSCTTSVAMTDDLDIKNCKVIRKLTVGELFTVEEGPNEDKEAGISRVKGKALNDDKEGWITIKGNAGTVYAEASSKHYTMLAEAPLQKKFASEGAEEIRKLAKGEALQVVEGPKEESFPPAVRVKGKALSDGVVGWITLKGSENVKPWQPFYKCLKALPLHDARNAEGAKVLRELAAEEVLELMEGPVEEGKELRMKGRAEKDGLVGWATIKDSEGKRSLEC